MADTAATFREHLDAWLEDTRFLSAGIFDNAHFRAIVDMGPPAVPLIIEEIKCRPGPLAHALDLIFPDVMEYEGFVSVEDACVQWVSLFEREELRP